MGSGLHWFRSDTSPVKTRIEFLALAMPNLKFVAYGNTHRNVRYGSTSRIMRVEYLSDIGGKPDTQSLVTSGP